MSKPSTVFISYSHDSAAHIDRVLSLSDRLREEGLDCEVDQYEPFPEDGWSQWMSRGIRNAEFVLVVCTKKYCERFEGRG